MITTTVATQTIDVECLPDPERVVEGLRDTGYTFNTAIADIIDNSIAAEATRVDIRIDMDPSLEIKVYIADNGIGMDRDGLINAMTYGSKIRQEQGNLGKFGLGLKTASTAFCRAFSLISRGEGDNTVRKAQWDLDYIAKKHAWKLKMPGVTRDELSILDETADKGSGTLVVWENVDRLLKVYNKKKYAQATLEKKITELKFHIGLVYQRFLDKNDSRANNVIITLNGEEIQAWDPFVIREPGTVLIAEPKEEERTVTMPDGSTASFILRAYMIPQKDNFSSPESKKQAKLSNDYQGFYVYRENRLIHHGDWLGMFIKEPHLSLLRVEFSFDHRLDSAFNVDIKKSRILLAEEIENYIKEEFMPGPRRAAEDRYRTGINKSVAKAAKVYDAHAASNKNIEEKAPKAEESTVTVLTSDEVFLTNTNGSCKHKIRVISNAQQDHMRVIPKETLENGQLWEPCIAETKHAVQINQSHPYYKKVYYPVLEQNVMVTGMDALLWALAEAELSVYNEYDREQYEDLRIAVSRILKKLVKDLPDPDLLTEENE